MFTGLGFWLSPGWALNPNFAHRAPKGLEPALPIIMHPPPPPMLKQNLRPYISGHSNPVCHFYAVKLCPKFDIFDEEFCAPVCRWWSKSTASSQSVLVTVGLNGPRTRLQF